MKIDGMLVGTVILGIVAAGIVGIVVTAGVQYLRGRKILTPSSDSKTKKRDRIVVLVIAVLFGIGLGVFVFKSGGSLNQAAYVAGMCAVAAGLRMFRWM